MRELIPALSVGALVLIACGSGATTDGSGGSGAAGSGSPSATATGVTGSASTASMATASTSTGGSGSMDLFPLGVGYGWTYDVAAVGAGSVCAAGSHTASVVGTSQLDGKMAYEMTNWCTGVTTNSQYAKGTGDQVFYDYMGQWLEVVAVPLQEGHTWTYFNTSYTWHQESSVTVPAGTFSDCWTAKQNVSYTAYLTYCRGAGLVRSYSSDLTGSGWDAKLSQKSF